MRLANPIRALPGLLFIVLMLFALTAPAAGLRPDQTELAVGEVTTVYLKGAPLIAIVDWKVGPELEILESDSKRARVRARKAGTATVTCEMNMKTYSVSLTVREPMAAAPSPVPSPAPYAAPQPAQMPYPSAVPAAVAPPDYGRPASVAPAAGVSGRWRTSEGEVSLRQNGRAVTGSYSSDGGEIAGEMNGNVLEGWWIENGSNERCATARNGRHHWGRVRWTFDGDRFAGTWSYCDKPVASGGGWNGERIGPAAPPQPANGLSAAELTSRTWRFGRSNGSVIAERVRLTTAGKLEGYYHPNEDNWALENGVLVFRNPSGQVVTRFTGVRREGGRLVLSGPYQYDSAFQHVLSEVGADAGTPPATPGGRDYTYRDGGRDYTYRDGGRAQGGFLRIEACVDGSDWIGVENGRLVHKHRSYDQIGTHGGCPASHRVAGGGFLVDGLPIALNRLPLPVGFSGIARFEVERGRGSVRMDGPNRLLLDDDGSGGSDVYVIRVYPDTGQYSGGSDGAPRVLEFAWQGMDEDRVGDWGNGRPNGTRDGRFRLVLEAPGRFTIATVSVWSANEKGEKAGGQIWHTRNGNNWMLGVFRDGRQLNASHVPSLGEFSGQVVLDLYANSSGWFNPGQWFLLEVESADGKVARQTLRLEASPLPSGGRDYTYRDGGRAQGGFLRIEACVDGSDWIGIENGRLVHKHRSHDQIGTHGGCPASHRVAGGGFLVDGLPIALNRLPLPVGFSGIARFEVERGRGSVRMDGANRLLLDDDGPGGSDVYVIRIYSQAGPGASVGGCANLARGKPASQSSTSPFSRPDDARGGVDGVISGGYGFHTNNERNPWWQVDLGTPASLGDLRVYNRQDCCGERARTLQVMLSDDARNWRTVYRHAGGDFGGLQGKPLTVNLAGERARYLRLQLNETNWLHLDEVEVCAATDAGGLTGGRDFSYRDVPATAPGQASGGELQDALRDLKNLFKR